MSTVRQVAPDTGIRIRGEQEISIPSSPLKCDTIDALPWFSGPEYGLEDEGELATPFISKPVPRLTDRLSGVFRRRDHQRGFKGHPQSSCFSVRRVSLNVPYRFRDAFPYVRDTIDVLPRYGKPEHGFENEGELSTRKRVCAEAFRPLQWNFPVTFPLVRTTTDVFPPSDRPEYGFEDEGQLTTPLVSKLVPRPSGAFRRHDYQHRVKIPRHSRAFEAVREGKEGGCLFWNVSPEKRLEDPDSASPVIGADNMRRVPVFGVEPRQIESNARARVRDGQWTGIPPFPFKRAPSTHSPRFTKPEHGFEDEGELATPFVNKSMPRLSDPIAKDFRRRSYQRQVEIVLPTKKRFGLDDPEETSPVDGTDNEPSLKLSQRQPSNGRAWRPGDQISTFPAYPHLYRRTPAVRKAGYKFEDEDELATLRVSESVTRLSDPIAKVFRRRSHQHQVKVVLSAR
ncbi:uncharacterized protein FOMMEDRAFT_157825 [Fomitiporia mediterranea MF3/22]|uniref:uncharacterized protein n=1 Tax=Fomitiporia mediterranea (strain MF3/22) TaxID=694068 RepID=UPI000440849E|nr:uncharacterized protein FOMMEDRAFT_157825 [Fomitiporia mediterranea MF3/22]EJD00724.1 hypothetical protein FOMMEDRAFT_157825 [Fomitiporia mediterranea MF3/22]